MSISLALTLDHEELQLQSLEGEIYLVVTADFGDFEPGWDEKEELLKLLIPKIESEE